MAGFYTASVSEIKPANSVSNGQEGELALDDAVVLIVDDNAQNLELIQAYMESLPCRLVTARDGVEAMARIIQDSPDLVLLDVMMPKMSGFEVCQRIKGNPATKDTVVVMVTAMHEVGDMERAVDCGCDDFVSKPVNKVELITRVRGLLQLRLMKRKMTQFLADRGRK